MLTASINLLHFKRVSIWSASQTAAIPPEHFLSRHLPLNLELHQTCVLYRVLLSDSFYPNCSSFNHDCQQIVSLDSLHGSSSLCCCCVSQIFVAPSAPRLLCRGNRYEHGLARSGFELFRHLRSSEYAVMASSISEHIQQPGMASSHLSALSRQCALLSLSS